MIVHTPESPLHGEMWFWPYHVISSATSIPSLGNIESFLLPSPSRRRRTRSFNDLRTQSSQWPPQYYNVS